MAEQMTAPPCGCDEFALRGMRLTGEDGVELQLTHMVDLAVDYVPPSDGALYRAHWDDMHRQEHSAEEHEKAFVDFLAQTAFGALFARILVITLVRKGGHTRVYLGPMASTILVPAGKQRSLVVRRFENAEFNDLALEPRLALAVAEWLARHKDNLTEPKQKNA